METVSHSNPILRLWYGLSPVLRFLIGFIVLIVVFYMFWGTQWFHNSIVKQVVTVNTAIASFILNIFGMDTIAQGSKIIGDQFTVNVKTGCDGLEGMAIFGSAVLAFPTMLSKKFKGLFAGIAFLFLLNLARIIQLYLTGIYYPDLFEILHQNIWQIIFIIIAIVLFGIWLAGLQSSKKKDNLTES